MDKSKIRKMFSHKFFKILKWAFLTLLIIYLILVAIGAVRYFDKKRTVEQVNKIHSTRITMDDVLGTNLPPNPGDLADKTAEGVDANMNGIRDDVELAIFEKYPNSAKTRAALLQYAMALQMEFTQPFLNETVATEIARENSRASDCMSDITYDDYSNSLKDYLEINKKLKNFVFELQFNSEERQAVQDTLYEKIGSFSSLGDVCDIDYYKLDN